MESSDDEQNPCGQNIQSTSSTSSMLPGASALSDVATQQVINVQILPQLSSISDRFNTLENKDVKKDLDPKKKKSSLKKKTDTHAARVTLPQHQCPSLTMPNLQSIRQDAFIQSQVDQELKELTNSDNAGTKIKSLRGVLLRWWSQIGLNGPKNLFCRYLKRKEYNMTSCRLSRWLATVAS